MAPDDKADRTKRIPVNFNDGGGKDDSAAVPNDLETPDEVTSNPPESGLPDFDQETFAETDRAFTPQQFAARHFRAGDSAAYIASRSQPVKDDKLIATPVAAAGTRVAPESNEVAPTREYASNRPFLDKGKSAKSLQAQNKPLTIEQVRELLNKSK